ncbi:hypothetical protein ILYODFUR_038503, partial [Ilyodon furcidens]
EDPELLLIRSASKPAIVIHSNKLFETLSVVLVAVSPLRVSEIAVMTDQRQFGPLI